LSDTGWWQLPPPPASTTDDARRRPGGLSTAIAYHDVDRPTSVTNTRAGSTVLAMGYLYDANGNVTSLTDDTGTAAFEYDDLDRLTSAAYPGGQTYTYGYDAVGNILSTTTPTGSQTFAYDLADRLTNPGYAYDDNGALTADPTRTYAYDALGRLTSATTGGITTSHGLDGAGNRWSETTGGTTTSFDLDLSQPYPTVLSDGTRKYLPGAPGAGYDQSGTWWSGLTDLVGTPIEYISQTGTKSSPIHRDAFGAPRPGSTVAGGVGFTGEWQDPTGLVNLRARAYDPAAARFVSRDTFAGVASAPETGNRYSYALNNPYRYTDPSGRMVEYYKQNPGELLSLAISFTPPGMAYGLFCAITGYDPIAGRALSDGERLLYAMPAIFKAIGKAWRFSMGLDDGARAGAEAFTGAGRAEAKAGILDDVGDRASSLDAGATNGGKSAAVGTRRTQDFLQDVATRAENRVNARLTAAGKSTSDSGGWDAQAHLCRPAHQSLSESIRTRWRWAYDRGDVRRGVLPLVTIYTESRAL
jgi:RHS repeat-associated protein